MSITVMLEYDIDASVVDRVVQEKAELLQPIVTLTQKHGFVGHRRLTQEGRFVDLDEWPSREHYARFKAEAQADIDAYESALGVRSAESVWDTAEG